MEVLTLRKHSQQSSGFLTHHSSSRSVLSLHCTHLPDSDPTAEQDRGSLHLTQQAYRELCDAKLLAKLTKPRKEPREAMGLQTANSQQTNTPDVFLAFGTGDIHYCCFSINC